MHGAKRKHTYLWVIGSFGTIFLLAGMGLYALEHGVNPRCRNLLDAYWLTTVFFFSGFEEFGPVTTGGKIISLFVFILGAGIMVVVTAKIASLFVRLELQEVKMPEDLSDHIAICNWNDRGDRIIKELHAEQAEPDTRIVVLTTAEINEMELRKSKAYENVFFMRSDPTLHDVLETSDVHRARSVILLADEKSPDPDAESALIALAITRLAGEGAKPHIVAEAMNHRKMEHLRDAGADEVVCATDYGLGVLAQCALNVKLSEVYHNLLTYSNDTNEIYIVEGDAFPQALWGKTFAEAERLISKHRDPNNPAVLIGVKRNGHTILNPMENWPGPAEQKFERFEKEDGLVVLSYDPPDLRHIRDDVQRLPFLNEVSSG